MVLSMIVLFVVCYAAIALEHLLKINKAAFALLLCVALWVIYAFNAAVILPENSDFLAFSQNTGEHLSFFDRIIAFVTEKQIIGHTGDIAEILFFLIGAMTIVELVDVHGGFSIITDLITTHNKKKLLWLLSFITFFMSAVLDNMTTAIVMVMLLRKFIGNKKERWLFASIIIIAANSGGAFSPIGDVTTIMLWVKGNITTAAILPQLIIPSLLSVIIPVFIVSRIIKGEFTRPIVSSENENDTEHLNTAKYLKRSERQTILFLGLGSLVFVPVFRAITNLPPFIGVLLGLSILWIYTEILYQYKSNIPERDKARITIILGRIDIATILFFLGILMSVAALECSGVLHSFSDFLAQKIGNIYIINILVGFLSSIVDNVPLVAGAMGMYPLANEAAIAASADPAYLANFVQDGSFWLFLAYCAGVGGSILIIGSAAGVVIMGLEKINFVWYFKHITLLVIAGYLAGAAFFVIQELWILPLLN